MDKSTVVVIVLSEAGFIFLFNFCLVVFVNIGIVQSIDLSCAIFVIGCLVVFVLYEICCKGKPTETVTEAEVAEIPETEITVAEAVV